MPDDNAHSDNSNAAPTSSAESPSAQPQQARSSILALPSPIKRLFDRFPLLTYPSNDLPQRAPQSRHQHILYVFATPEDATRGAPSFNPGCLKWQAYLKFYSIPFRCAASNNHASPSGALPFLLPAAAPGVTALDTVIPVQSSKLQKWVAEQGAERGEPEDVRWDAYMALVDVRIRRAWLYALYLTANFHSVAVPLYITPTTSFTLLRLSLSRTLRAAAAAELRKHAPVIDPDSLYADADEALTALEELLGQDEWFFGAEKPGMLDAAVFAYTHLLLEDRLGEGWVDGRLSKVVKACEGLRRHRERVMERYFERGGVGSAKVVRIVQQ